MKSLHVTLLLASIAIMQLFFGGGDGTRLIYTLPGHLLLGLAGVLGIFSIRKASARMDRTCLITIASLAIYLFARIASSPSAWLAQFDFYALLAGLLAYFVTALFVRSDGARYGVICGLLVLAVLQVGIGIFQFGKDANFNPLVVETRAEAGFRASGTYISPNHLAGFLEVALILATSLFFWGGSKARAKMIAGYVALVCLAGLVLTGSRGGYLSAGAGLAVFAVASVWAMRSRLAHGVMRRIVAIAVAVVLIGGALALVAERSFAIRTRANTVFVASDIRTKLWKAAWQQFRLAPVLGTGSRTYVYYGRMYRSADVQTDPVFVHNDWLQALAEYGVAGMLLIVAFVVAHLRHAWRRWSRMAGNLSAAMPESAGKHALAIQIGTISALAAVLVHALVDFNLHIPANLLLVAFLFGLLATRETETRMEKAAWPARALHALPAALGLWMLVAGTPRVPGELFAETARGKFMARKTRAFLADAGQALSRGVRNPELYFQLGEVQRFYSQNLTIEMARKNAIEDASELYAKAVAIFPQDVGLVLRQAWALDRLGRFDEAEPLLVRAKGLDPNSPMPWAYGALHWKMRGMPAEALSDFRKCGYGWMARVLSDLNETFDPAALESMQKRPPGAEPR